MGNDPCLPNMYYTIQQAADITKVPRLEVEKAFESGVLRDHGNPRDGVLFTGEDLNIWLGNRLHNGRF